MPYSQSGNGAGSPNSEVQTVSIGTPYHLCYGDLSVMEVVIWSSVSHDPSDQSDRGIGGPSAAVKL